MLGSSVRAICTAPFVDECSFIISVLLALAWRANEEAIMSKVGNGHGGRGGVSLYVCDKGLAVTPLHAPSSFATRPSTSLP